MKLQYICVLKNCNLRAARIKYLESQRYKVVRFWNDQVENEMDSVIQELEAILNDDQV